MNRILLEKEELSGTTGRFGGERAEHVLKVLHGEVGQTLKTGEIGGRIGLSRISAIDGGEIVVEAVHDTEPLPSWVDIVLAPPRPRAMKRLIPQLATLGVGRIVLVGAKKVEKDFWGATLLKEANYRPLFIDGLMQGGVSTELPVIELRRNFRRFVNEELDAMFPTSNRVIAHPYAADAPRPAADRDPDARLLLAVGPEGGWTDDEVALLEERGFARHSLGARILRTDTALIALLSQFMKGK